MAYVENPVAYERARIARIRANARVGKAQRWMAEDATRQEVVDFLNGPGVRGEFLAKMAESLREWGSLTEKQEAAVRKCMTGNAERDAKRAQENAAAAPVPAFTGRAMMRAPCSPLRSLKAATAPRSKCWSSTPMAGRSGCNVSG